MSVKPLITSAGCAIALSLLAPSVQALPASANAAGLKLASPANVEKAAYRRCWWRHGREVCRWVGYRYYDDDDYGYYGGPYYGYGPGITFGFGGFGGGGHFHGGHGGHHR